MNPKVTIAVDTKNKAVASITGMLTVGAKVDVEITGITYTDVPEYGTDDKFVGRSLRLRIVDEMGNDLARYPLVEKTATSDNDKWTVDTANSKFSNDIANGRVFDMDTNELRRVFKCIPFNEQLEFGIILDSIKDNAQYAIGKVKVRQWAAVSEDDPTLLPNMADTLAKLQNASASVSKPVGSTIATISITDTHGVTTSTTISDGATGPQGATGPRGNDGSAATIAVGTVTTGAAGTQAAVVNSGTSSAAVFDFTIPRGDTGASGTDDNAVHYSADSNKTEEQKAAARTNIGAVAAESGKRLMTDAEGTKLSGIATGATNVVESTVSGWGFTKNTGTYSKPDGGIPKTDLASDVQTSLGNADSALQSVPVATSSALGGIKADPKTSVQTQEVKIDTATGKLYVAPGGGGTGNYDDLTNKPKIGGVTLQGNNTLAEIGAVPTSRTINNQSLTADITLTAANVGAVAANTAITGSTKCKITYDAKGLVTAGADLAASDIPDLVESYVKKTGQSSQSVEGQLSVGALYVGGTKVEVVSAVPASPIADTLYFITGS